MPRTSQPFASGVSGADQEKKPSQSESGRMEREGDQERKPQEILNRFSAVPKLQRRGVWRLWQSQTSVIEVTAELVIVTRIAMCTAERTGQL